MPLVRCTKDGKSGWKWGQKNKACFTGPGARAKALRQGRAIEYHKAHSEMVDLLHDPSVEEEDLKILIQELQLDPISILAAEYNRRNKNEKSKNSDTVNKN